MEIFFLLLSCMCLFIGLVFIGAVVVVVLGLLSPSKVVPGEEFLATAGATLFPWSQQAFEDIAARWQGRWRFSDVLGNVRGYAQGVVKSLRRPNESGWLAFHLDRPSGKEAHLYLRSTAHQLTLDLQLENVMPPTGTATVTLNGQPFGVVRLPECVFFDPDGNQVGHYERHTPVIRTLRRYSPVVVGNRTLAELSDTWSRLPESALRHLVFSSPQPALRAISPHLTETEEHWLLVALALELFFDSNRRRPGGQPFPWT